MAAIEDFSDDFPQYLAETAREMAEMGRRTERAIEEMRAVTAAIQRDSRLAREALYAAVSGLNDISGGLRDFNKTAYEATRQATESLLKNCEQSKGEMRRLVELSDMLAAYLSASRDQGPEPEDEEPDPGAEEPEQLRRFAYILEGLRLQVDPVYQKLVPLVGRI